MNKTPMNIATRQPENDYRLDVRPLSEPVIVRHHGEIVAESRNAKVMYETRLPPTYYFPRGDVIARLEPSEGFKTFCPFKGSASYWHVNTALQTLSNAAWSYLSPLEDARDVGGYVAFSASDDLQVDLSGNVIEALSGGNVTGPTVDWLVREAWRCPTPEALTEAFSEKLIEDGVSIMRTSVMVWSLHPMIAGRNYLWERGTPGVQTRAPSYDILDDPAFENSPLRYVTMGRGGVRQHLTVDDAEFSFPIMAELKAQGATDYVAMPMFFSDGQINVLTITSDHPEGFTTANLGHVFECSTVISRFYEVFALKENASTLLETYLGRGTGARVLNGEIRRGDGEEIDAAILFCDLRHSSRLVETSERSDYLNLLNNFFDCVAGAVNSQGGEVLKFIGDAVLAVFPAEDGKVPACIRAVDAAREIDGSIQSIRLADSGEGAACAIGIAYGNVAYGNVGSSNRLDFTVIGTAANVAARLSDLGKVESQTILAEAQVADAMPDTMTSLGEFNLHNVSLPVRAFAPRAAAFDAAGPGQRGSAAGL